MKATDTTEVKPGDYGMTVRTRIAMEVLAGYGTEYVCRPQFAAISAVERADALIKELNKPTSE